jgi:hypothetical protein
VRLPEHDPLSHETWLAVAHLDAGNNEGKIYLAAPLNPDDLRDRMDRHEVVDWDAARGCWWPAPKRAWATSWWKARRWPGGRRPAPGGALPGGARRKG